MGLSVLQYPVPPLFFFFLFCVSMSLNAGAVFFFYLQDQPGGRFSAVP